MTPEELKASILLLAKPLDDFMREHGIASFLLGDGDENSAGTFDISATRIPLPPKIKCTLKLYGSIYMIDDSAALAEIGRKPE